jgi:hypothetical protein
VQTLRDALGRVLAGEQATILVGGEAGVGKSRLVHELIGEAASAPLMLAFEDLQRADRPTRDGRLDPDYLPPRLPTTLPARCPVGPRGAPLAERAARASRRFGHPRGGNGGGSVNPNGQATTAQFQYGRTNAYGSTTASQPFGSDSREHGVSAAVGALQPGVSYHCRVVATNVTGTTYGPDQTFKTTTASPRRHARTSPRLRVRSIHVTRCPAPAPSTPQAPARPSSRAAPSTATPTARRSR